MNADISKTIKHRELGLKI